MDRHAGVISDTHGLLRPEVFEVFKDVDLIFHAGDIGSSEVLEKLKTLAPVANIVPPLRGWDIKGTASV